MSVYRNRPRDGRPVIVFTERQNGIVAAGITVLCATLVTGFIALILWAVFSLLAAVSVVLTPLIVAVILAVLLKPYYIRLHERLGLPNWLALLVLFLSILIPLGALFFFFGTLFVTQFVS